MSEHLGELAAALADGALDHETRDRALVHLTDCADCRREVDAQRRLKRRLAAAAGPDLPPGLAERLRAIARDPGRGDDGGPLPWTPVMAGFARPPGRPPAASRPASRTRWRFRGRRSLAAAGVAFAVGTGLMVTLLPRQQQAAVSPQVGAYTVEHASTTGTLPGADPAAGAVVTVSFSR